MTKRVPWAFLPQVFAVSALFAPLSATGAESRFADLPFPTLTAAWGDSNRAWQGMSREARHERVVAFFEGFHSADLCRICRESVGVKETERLVQGFLRAKFEVLPPSVDETIDILQDLTVGSACHKVVIQHLSRTRDSYGAADGDRLGQALLGLADHAAYPPGIEGMLEIAAAHLSSSDSLLARMERYARGDRPERAIHAFEMMAESKDPRAADLMERTLDGYRRNGELPPGRMIVGAGLRLGPRAYPFLVWCLGAAPDEPTRWKVFEGLGHSKDPRAMGHLLAAYGDSASGIRDETSMITDRAEKERYFELWSFIRLLEPTIVKVLAGSDARLRAQALELVDRESRYGIPADPPALTQALREYAGLAGQDSRNIRRVMEILARFELRERERPKH